MSMIIDGTNGLTFNNATTQASAGCVLQVVNATYGTQVTNSTSTYADTGLTATITPKFNTSKILVLINHTENYKTSGNVANTLALNLCRNGSQIVQFNASLGYTNSSLVLAFSASYTYLDSPATTSATTYKTQFKNGDANAAAVYVQFNGAASPSSITLMEIAG
jgi:hypothetical protein